MSSDRTSRHRLRQEKIDVLREHRDATEAYRVPITSKSLKTVIPSDSSDVLSEFSKQQRDELAKFTAPVSVSAEEADQLINDIRSRWDQHQVNLLLGNCRGSILSSIVGPFGLGTVVAAYDKTGGNVDTVHNARSGVYATEKAQAEYDNRGEYDSDAYHQHENYVATNRKNSEALSNGTLKDAYSGETFKPQDRHDQQAKPNLDHAVAAINIHDDAGRVLAGLDGADLANIDANLHSTNASVNKSKKAKTAEEFKSYLDTTAPDRRSRISELEAKGGALTDQERKQLSKLQKLENCDAERIVELEEQARSTIDKSINKAYYGSLKFGRDLAHTSAKEGAKMGVQQSFGLLLTEFFAAAFDEISDAYKKGFRDSLKNQSFFDALKERLGRIASRVASKWKDALVAFKEGAISGFLSNLVTTLINMLVTTGKRLVRVIREGFMSIMKALKMALFPPKGMSSAEASDAALKLLATGVTVSLGILAEEVVEKSVTAFFSANLPPLVPLASTVSAVFVGAMTGIASALLVYGLDKLDIFGVNAHKQHAFVLQELDNLIADSDKNISSLYDEEMGRFDGMIAQLQSG